MARRDGPSQSVWRGRSAGMAFVYSCWGFVDGSVYVVWVAELAGSLLAGGG